MRAAEHLREILNATGVYHLTGDTPVDWELEAYGAGFAVLEDAWEKLREELFLETAPKSRLDRWEELFRAQPSSEGEQERREALRVRFSVHPGLHTPGEFSAMLKAAGIRGAVRETEEGIRVALGRFLGITEEEARRELDRLLPAHLPWELDKSATWAALNACGKTFADWDALGLDWAAWDALDWNDLQG